MSSLGQDPSDKSNATIRELLAQVTIDISKLISTQIELVKAELKQSASNAGAAFGLMAAALLVFSVAIFFFFFFVAFLLNHFGLPMWASFLIVTGFLVLVGLIMLIIGIRQAKKIRGPERAAAQMEMTKQAFEDAATSALTK